MLKAKGKEKKEKKKNKKRKIKERPPRHLTVPLLHRGE